jgi:hypothetical protein
MPTTRDRAFRALNLEQYDDLNRPDMVGKKSLFLPDEDFYILRMLIKTQFGGGYKLPEELEWVRPLILKAHVYQRVTIGVAHPYCYLTIRKGKTKSVTDDEWHVDGFSQAVTHLPEQNYIWCDILPTEYLANYPIKIPSDFNPMRHNIHSLFQKDIENNDVDVKYIEPETLYCLDPYIIHRRPALTDLPLVDRTFIRISFTPIEIADVNNTINPLLLTDYTRDGVKEMRDKLIDY